MEEMSSMWFGSLPSPVTTIDEERSAADGERNMARASDWKRIVAVVNDEESIVAAASDEESIVAVAGDGEKRISMWYTI
jgi:hypothetical protein